MKKMNHVIRKGAFERAHGRSSAATCVRAIVDTSKLEIFGKRDADGWIWVLLRFYGTAATLPSTTNNRMLTVPRQHVLKQLSNLLGNPAMRSYMVIKQLIDSVKGLRAFISKSPEQQQKLQAMSHLYQTLASQKPIEFLTEPKKRALVTLLLSPDMNRFDSHNIPKAVCDWMQEQKIIANDRHVDTFARRKTDAGIAGQSSDILIMRYPEANLPVDAALGPVTNIINELEKNKNGNSNISAN